MIYKRYCSNCDSTIEYINKKSFARGKREDNPCRKCYSKEISKTIKRKLTSGEIKIKPRRKDSEIYKQFHRNCPDCDNKMSYVSEETLKTAINKNTVCNSCSTYKYNKNWKNVIKPSHIKQMRASKAGFLNWDEYVKRYPDKQFYKREVWRLTNAQPLHLLEHNEKRGLCGINGAYQLDHIISINDGWEQKIDEEEISKFENLRCIPWKQNRTKG